MKNYLMLLLVSISLFVSPGYAGNPKPDVCKNAITMNANRLEHVLDFTQRPACLVELILSSPQYADTQTTDAGTIRALLKSFTQLGSSVGTGGTTNLVSKGLGANFLSAAAEYGALTQSTNNQTVTVSGSLGGIPTALISHKVLSACAGTLAMNSECVSSRTQSVLNRFSYGVTFDTSQNAQALTGTSTSQSQGSTQPVVFTANTQQITQVVGKVVLIAGQPATRDQFIDRVKSDINKDHPISKDSQKLKRDQALFEPWQTANKEQFASWQSKAIQLLTGGSPATASAPSVLAAWENADNQSLLGCTLVDLMGGPECRLRDAPSFLPSAAVKATMTTEPTLFGDVNTFASDYSTWIGEQKTYADSLRAKPVLTFEYNDNRPASQPSNSVFRLVFGKSVNDWTFTLNGAAAIYNAAPSSAIPGSSRFRDIQVAAEADYDLSKKLWSGTSAGVAYYFQDQTSPAILNVDPSNPVTGVTFIGLPSTASQIYAQKGVINIAQAKLVIGSNQHGMSFPIAVSWSNRTELITKPAWKAQVGFTYNFDSLFPGTKAK